MKKELSKKHAIILLIIFIAIGGLILYKEDPSHNNFSPLDYVFKR
ncbi:MAG: hypothetical protein WC603_00820 [Candidatus Paceibacterota bacterium]|jgi:Ni,Fe-hydrogenase I cytochrome b subunit